MSKSERNKRYYQKHKHKDYNDWVYCLDIETSTADGINAKGETVKCSYIISYAISKLNWRTGEIIHDSFNRRYEDLEEDFERIEKEADGRKTLIYIHNFSYEFSFFKDNVKYFQNNISKQLFIKMHKPLLINCNILSFRCSYLLLGKSVKTLGNELTSLTGEDWRKLDYEYNAIRTPYSVLTDEEIAYNFRDCDIVLKYIYEKLLKTYSIKDLHDKLFTQTGIVRFDNKKNNTTLDYKKFCLFNKDCVPDARKQYDLEVQSFMGGLVSFDFNIITKKLENVASFDASSDYPFQMLKPFPTHFYYNGTLKDIDNFKRYCSDPKYNTHNFWYGIITIKNLKLNKFNYAILSKHKFYETVDCEDSFGKVLEATIGTLICTSLDFENYKKFYDFEILEIKEIYTNKYLNYLPDFTISTIARLLKAKSELKKYVNEVKHKEVLYNNYEFSESFKYLQDEINNQDNYEIQKAIINAEYQRIKGHLNSTYGIAVEKPIKSDIKYDFEIHEYFIKEASFEKFKAKKYVKTNMLVGTFITAYARTHLITLLYQCLINGVRVYYTDTDSLKLDYSNPEKVNKIVEDFNNSLFDAPYGIGKFEFEGDYKYFVVNGNKSYISLSHENNIDATIAGLPEATIIYSNLYKNACNGDFDKLIKDCFSFNIEILPEVTNKLTSKYPLKTINDDMEDDSTTDLIHIIVDDYEDYVYSGLVLDDCPVTIKGIDTSINNIKSCINMHRFFNFDLNKIIDKKQIMIDSEKSTNDEIIFKVADNGKIGIRIQEVLKKWQEELTIKDK